MVTGSHRWPVTPAADVVRSLIRRVYRGRDRAALELLVADDAAEVRAECLRILDLLAGFPDARPVLEDLIDDGGWIVARLTVHGTHLAAGPGPDAAEPTGRRIAAPLFGMFRVDGGRIVQSWQRLDEQVVAAGLADPANAVEPALELDEIQGNVLPGFRKDHFALVYLEIRDLARARARVARQADVVATAAEVLDFMRLFGAATRRRGHRPGLSATWRNLAFSCDALRRFAPDADQIDAPAFQEGMHSRAATPAADWVVGSPGSVPDVVVLLAADDEPGLAAECAALQAELGDGFDLRGIQRGAALPGEREHFGFRDGVSQPGIRGHRAAPPFDPITPRRDPRDVQRGHPGQRLVWPGEFVLGYPAQDAADPALPGPVADVGPQWTRNGTFLVYARYRQDTEGFAEFLTRAGAAIAEREPELADLSPHRLGALLVGRWRSGAPVMRAPGSDAPELGGSGRLNNDFAYRQATAPLPASAVCPVRYPPAPADPAGLRCPLGAHIRKAYLRDDTPPGAIAGDVQRHRMLRRGVPYTDETPTGVDRGLLFLSYQVSIERQFEFVLQQWLRNPSLRVPGEGVDPLLGVVPGGPTAVRIPVGDGGRAVEVDLERSWTELTGGGYFFVPSVSALRHLAGC
ncbi:Dyp-type peroxidase [Saccharopolyspora elongata]|uniref:Dyp-type peroxidase n=1 Tax=Saccharopolyspora elongata TaxID=2530387 RepID=UPI0014048F36|nr:Dyp-type peroxidase [Saccharopolyspora elongata]